MKPHIQLIKFFGIIVPRRLRIDWRQEWEAELHHRELMLKEWNKLNYRSKLNLLIRSIGAFWDALLLQPRRLEDEMFQDIKFGLRMLIKQPTYTLIIVITLSLGIGASTAIFSLLDAVLFRSLPMVEAPDQIVMPVRSNGYNIQFSYLDFEVLRKRNDIFSGLALYTPHQIAYGNGTRSEVVVGSIVSGNYFDVMKVKPILGRGFLPEEDKTPKSHPVVILSHSFWQSRFNSDRNLIGKTITLNNQQFTVIGIAPSGFIGQPPIKMSLWIPVMMAPAIMFAPLEQNIPPDLLSNPQQKRFSLIGRLKNDVSVLKAQSILETVNSQLERDAIVRSGQQITRRYDHSLRLMNPRGMNIFRNWGITGSKLLVPIAIGVLLISCANIANLLLVRAATRRKEIAVRLAMGSTRFRLIRQLLTESISLAVISSIAGLLTAFWINQLLKAFKPPFPPPFTFTLDLPLESRMLGFTILLSILTGIIFGIVPALQASKPNIIGVLKGESNTEKVSTRRRYKLNIRNVLVITQIALSLVMLISTGLFLRSLDYAQQIDLGFKPDNVLTVSFNLRPQGYTLDKGKEFYKNIVERLGRLPGAETASITNMLPLGFIHGHSPVVPEGRIPQDQQMRVSAFSIGLQYFDTLKIQLIRGRDFTRLDTISSSPVAIVSERLARTLWPEIKDPGEALGKKLRTGQPELISCEVVGIVKDSQNSIFNPIHRDPDPTIYRPFAQDYSAFASVVVRVKGDPKNLISAVRNEIAALDKNLPPEDLQPLSDITALSIWSARASAMVFSFFSFLGLVLASIGIYGVLSYSVAQRTNEIGLRMALGAQKLNVIKLITSHGLKLAIIGTSIGLVAAFGLTRLLTNRLYGVKPTDPITFILVPLFLVCVALLACLLPALKATKIDPLSAIRYE